MAVEAQNNWDLHAVLPNLVPKGPASVEYQPHKKRSYRHQCPEDAENYDEFSPIHLDPQEFCQAPLSVRLRFMCK